MDQDVPEAYKGKRKEIISLIPRNKRKILDVGCSTGSVGEEIKNTRTAEVCGVDCNPHSIMRARKKLDDVIVADLDHSSLRELYTNKRFDCIIFADILEHTKNPWKIVEDSIHILKKNGVVIVSLPNIRFYKTILNLLKGNWEYNERGLYDKTHLRFFTLKTMKSLLEKEYDIISIKRKYRLIEKPHYINRFAKVSWIPFLRDFFVFQYIFLLRRKKYE